MKKLLCLVLVLSFFASGCFLKEEVENLQDGYKNSINSYDSSTKDILDNWDSVNTNTFEAQRILQEQGRLSPEEAELMR